MLVLSQIGLIISNYVGSAPTLTYRRRLSPPYITGDLGTAANLASIRTTSGNDVGEIICLFGEPTSYTARKETHRVGCNRFSDNEALLGKKLRAVPDLRPSMHLVVQHIYGMPKGSRQL
jgi:hypothetical protein